MIVHHICPPKIAHLMASEYDVVNQLLLAQEWSLSDPSIRDAVGPNGSIIVDNGSWEGDLVSLANLLKVAELHNADFVVLPDVGGDAEKTRKHAEDAAIVEAEGFTPLVAMQSVDWAGLYDDIQIYRAMGIKHVGLASRLMYPEWVGDSRVEILRSLAPELEGLHVHLLGLMERPQELLEIAQDPVLKDLVLSVDTASALRWAMRLAAPAWGTQLHIPRWIWRNLTMEDLSDSVLWQWNRNRDALETMARGIE